MPTLPLIVNGTVTGADDTYKVSARNQTQDTTCTGDINSSGAYLIDLNNCGWTIGDIIYVKAYKTNKIIVSSFTITQTMSDEGNYALDLTIRDLREQSFWTIYNLLNDNKPDAFTDVNNSDEVTWNVNASFADNTPSFPQIEIKPIEINHTFIDLSNAQQDNMITSEIMFWSVLKYKKGRIDNGRGSVVDTLMDNQKILEFSGMYFDTPDFIEDSNVDELELGDQTYNIATQIYHYKWRP